MPTNKQRRQAAQKRLQRQLERREQIARKRRRNLLIGVTVVAVLAVVGAFFIITNLAGRDTARSTAASSTATSPAAAAPAGQTTVAGPCTYTTDGTASAGVPVTPPSGDIATTGTLALTMTTSAGAIGIDLNRATAPCAAASFAALTQQHYFDNTPCHRLTTSDALKVLQCGDPSGKGTGGPGYTFPTQVTGSETYHRGTVAMANSGHGTDGSQFFLVYGDSTLQPNYTVVGTIDEAGLAVLDTIAAGGVAGGSTDGAPAAAVTITSMTAAQ